MAFLDWENNPELADKDPSCSPDDNWRVWVHCPNLKPKENDRDMSGEHFVCKKCGRTEIFDYDSVD